MLDVQGIQTLAGRAWYQLDSAQAAARGVLRELLGRPPEFHWTYDSFQLAKVSSALLAEIERLALVDPARMDEVSPQAARVARTWEALARTRDTPTRRSALINAAAAYEYAGLQANGTALARSILPTASGLDRLAGHFLTRQLLLLRHEAIPLLREPPDLERRSDAEITEAIALGASARGLDMELN